MQISPWLNRLRNRLRPHAGSRRVLTTERLENRAMLTVTGVLVGTELSVFVDGGDDVSIQTDPATGSVQVIANGSPATSIPSVQSSVLTALNLFADSDDNTLDVSAVSATDFASLAINGSIVIEAGDGDDQITGSDDFGESITGGDGNDTIDGRGGDDTIDGGDGNDVITGGLGADSLDGDDGNDTIDGGDGGDNITAGDGADSVTGGAGMDTIDAGQGNDVVDAGDDDDTVNGMSGNDTISGGAGNDSILAGSGNDSVSGDDGDDVINGQGGDDTANGNAGNDTILGGSGKDSLVGDAGNDNLNGQAGNDTVAGESGADTLLGGSGADVLAGGTENDTVLGHGGDDTLFGGGGADSLNGGSGRDRVEGVGLFVSDSVSTPAPLLASISNATPQAEGSTTTSFVFTVTLSASPTQTVSVDYTVADGTAQAGSDYLAASGTVTFTPGVTSQVITVTVTGDTTGEDDENFFVNLAASADVALQDGQGIGTVLDDDGGPLPMGTDFNYDRFADLDFADPNGPRRWTMTASDATTGMQGDPITLTWGIVPDGTVVIDDLISGSTTNSDLIAQLDSVHSETATGTDVTNRTWFVAHPGDDGVHPMSLYLDSCRA